ncbi:TolC family protein [Fulvivirga maritima]|uniref:TolC family protein n=1 Tax=Fulvivirga maritima TaxID=2904247 RepID=UPI001F294F48|nr:TolC family protein [Fulvivirga maritima]UII25538.1 TolC family protein [Fulvivirga maritima]
MKHIIITSIIIFSSVLCHAQDKKLTLSQEEAEALLLKQNLGLLAEQLNIDIAEAEVIQAKVWPNPTLSVDEINLWSTSYQKKTGETLPSLFGSESFGRQRQISAQIEQLVQLAGKRKKRIAIEQVNQEIADAYLEDFLLSLRTEFRETIFQFQYSKLYIDLLERQVASLATLINSYRQQFEEGNINKADLIRLQATHMAMKDELIEINEELNEQESQLIVMLNLEDNTTLSFTGVFDESFNYGVNPEEIELTKLQELALDHQPSLLIANHQVSKANKQFAYEKALRTPDLNLSVGYDRGGNIMQDFIGVGFALDLPIFDRNKGGIKRAQAEIDQAQLIQQEATLKVKSEVRQKLKNLQQVASFFETINASYVNDLDKSMEAYNQFFKDQTVNMLSYLDFMEAYIDNMQIIFENQMQYLTALEELNYITGLNLQHHQKN